MPDKKKQKGGNNMKKILSVMLVLCMMISLCSAFAIMPSFADGEAATSPVYDASEEEFSVTVTDDNGRKAGYFNRSDEVADIYDIYTNGYTDTEYGKYKVGENCWVKSTDGTWVYEVVNPASILTTHDKNLCFGGYYSDKAGSCLPMNKFPINIDIDLNGAKPISGVKLYTRTGSDRDGYVKAYNVYVKFDGDDDWTYIVTDGNQTTTKTDMETAFGQNLKVTDVRIQVTEVDTTSQAKSGKGWSFEAGLNCYFYLPKVEILKPYNEGGAEYTTAPATATSADELDEISLTATDGAYLGKDLSADVAKRAMDNDLSTNTYANGNLCLDFGKNVLFRGIRYYPPKDYGTKYGGTTLFQAMGILGQLNLISGSVADSVSGEGTTKTLSNEVSIAEMPYNTLKVEYPKDAEGNYDYTKPVTILFSSPVSAQGIKFASWLNATDTEKPIDYVGVGEIRLIKPEEHWNGYYNTDDETGDVVEWETVPTVTKFASTNSLSTTGGYNLFDRKIYTEGVNPNNTSFAGVDFGLNDNRDKGKGMGYINLVVDLGKEYEFSAVRLFSRLAQPGQALSEGNLYISDDGETWSAAMPHADKKDRVDYYRPTLNNDGGEQMSALLYYESSRDIYTDLKGNDGENTFNLKARYIKIEVKKTFDNKFDNSGQHFSAQEILLVKPKSGATKTAFDLPADYSNGYYYGNDKIVKWDEINTDYPKVTTSMKIRANGAEVAKGYGSTLVFDRKIGIDRFENEALLKNHGISFDYGLTEGDSEEQSQTVDGSSVYFIADLGKEYTFSAVRLFWKVGQIDQAMQKGDISFSADGTNWFTAFDHEDNYTSSGTVAGSDVVKYNSTGDIYTDVKATINGKSKNVTARYIKVHATKSHSGHLGVGQLMLVTPDTANGEALDAKALDDAVKGYVDEVEEKINEIGDVDESSESKITAAREAYDSLLASQKKLVSEETLKKLTDAEDAFEKVKAQRVIDMITRLPSAENVELIEDSADITAAQEAYDELSDANKALVTNAYKLEEASAALSGLVFEINMGTISNTATANGTLMGTQKATFTLYGEKEIASIKYGGVTYTAEDGWFTRSTADGKTTLVIGGAYDKDDYIHTGVGADVAAGKDVYALADMPSVGLKAGDKIKFEGKLVNKILNDNPLGVHHYITVNFSDDSSKEINLKSTGMAWTSVDKIGEPTEIDEITPTTDWKVAQSDGRRANIGSYIFANGTQSQKYYEAPFQGFMHSLDASTKVVAAKKYVAGQNVAKYDRSDLYIGYTLWNAPQPTTFYVDMGENPEPYNGVRFYGRDTNEKDNGSNWNVGIVDIWGSNDAGYTWEEIGHYDLKDNTDMNKEIIFFKDKHTVNYRYVMFTVQDIKQTAAYPLEIKNLAFVKPYVTVDTDTVVQDIEDSLVEDSVFNFTLIDDAKETESEKVVVKKGTTLLGDGAYTYADGVLTVKASWVTGQIKEGTEGTVTLTVTFPNKNVVDINVERKNVKTATYWLTGAKDGNGGMGSGTDSLVLTAIAGKKAKSVTVNGTKVSFSQTDSDITIKRYDFRRTDVWDNYKNDGKIAVTVEFTDGKTATYNVILKGIKYTVDTSQKGTFKRDEITAGAWVLETDSMYFNTDLAKALYTDPSAKNTTIWHSGYIADGGAQGDTLKGYHLDIDLLQETEFSGFRYYTRTSTDTSGGNDRSGIWYNVTVYGRNSEDEEWTALSSTISLKYTDDNDMDQDIKLDSTAKCRYVRLVVNNNAAYATMNGLRLLKETTAFKGAEMAESEIAMDFALKENANAKAILNSAGKIKGISYGGNAVPAEYLIMTADTVSIAPAFFEDNEIKDGKAEFTLSFSFGDDVKFTVNVGEVAGNTFEFVASNEWGTISATAYNEKIGVTESKTTGDKVRNTDKLTFTATADEGYEVDEWKVEAAKDKNVYERVDDSAKKKWSATATSQQNNSVMNTIDGNTDSDNNYWHSKYTVTQETQEDGTVKNITHGDPNFPYVLTYDFKGTIKNAHAFEYIPRTNSAWKTNTVKDYKIWVLEEGAAEDNWTLAAEGTLAPTYDETVKIDFNKDYSITKLKFKIHSLNGNYSYINEIYVWAEKLPTGKVTRTGTASQDFEIDERFTDMVVSVSFKPVASGTVSVKTQLSNLTSDAKASYEKGSKAEIKLTADKGYYIKDAADVSVTLDGAALKAGADYNVTVAEGGASAALTVNSINGGTLTVTAKGTPTAQNHKITYVDNLGATGTLPSESYVLEGDEFTVASGSNLTLTGYKFAGWTSSLDIASEGEEGGEEKEEKIYTAGEKLTMGACDIIFTAKWTVDNSKKDESGSTQKPTQSNKPSSNKGGTSSGGGGGVGGGASTVFTVTINGTTTSNVSGTVVPAPAAPEGYTFTGWYLDEAHTVPYANTGVTENITLYPAFEKNRSSADLTDIQGHWAYNDIAKLYEKKIVNGSGEGKYNPDDSITRAEFIQILYNMSKMTSDGSHKFKDVKVGDWFLQAVAWAVNYGITSGTSDEEFSPYEKITREQMAAMIYRYAVLMGADWQTAENGEFADGGEISEYAQYYVRWAKGMGIINGRDDGTFGPKDNATRAESAAMLSRLVTE